MAGAVEIDAKRDRLVIFASTLGTVFEWYDFFVYGTLANIVAGHFFPSDNPAVSLLIFLASFGVGFGMRPLGAVLFGVLGDRLGRKYTFLVTIAMMGVATAAVGVLPTYESIGVAAPILLVLCRVFQGLALGGEYGGAAIYVAEHAPANRRGFYTSFIQSGVIGGFLLSLAVVLVSNLFVDKEAFTAWGWRIPFLFSLVLLGISLWVRLKLKESPVFKAMKDSGEIASNPLRESFAGWQRVKMILVALFGIAAGLTVIWYTSTFSARSFLLSAMRVEESTADIIVGLGAAIGMGFYLLFGHISDKVGRKKPIVAGYLLTLILLFPVFWTIGQAANPGLAAAAVRSPVVVTGPDCSFDPFAAEQKTGCGKLLGDLTAIGVSYERRTAPELGLSVGSIPVSLAAYPWADKAARGAWLQKTLARFGYDFAKVTPTTGQAVVIIGGLLLLMALSGMTYGPVAALLSEMFPPKIRYSSMSIPYHIGTGYFGGFLPLISGYIVARTGNPYSGLWYTWVIVAVSFVVAAWGLRGGAPRDFSDQD